MSDENDVTYWTAVLHKAAAAHKANANDREASDTVQLALQNIQEINDYQNRRDVTQARDRGKGTAFALGAARGMSFGLGDLAQDLTSTEEEKRATATTEAEHPGMMTAGEVTGAALPYVAGGVLAGAGKIGAGAASRLLPRTAIGAAQGFGLSHGNALDRLPGAVLGGGLAGAGPPVASMLRRGAGGISGLVSRLGQRAGSAAPEAAPAVAGKIGSAKPWQLGPRMPLAETPENLAEARAVRGTPIQQLLRRMSTAVHGEAPPTPSDFRPLGPNAFGGQTTEEIAPGVRRSAMPGRAAPEPDAVRTAMVQQMSQRSPESFASPEVMARVQRGAPQSQLVYQAKRLLGRPPSPQSEIAVRALFANMPQQARQTAVQEFVQNVGQAPQAWVPILTNILERP